MLQNTFNDQKKKIFMDLIVIILCRQQITVSKKKKKIMLSQPSAKGRKTLKDMVREGRNQPYVKFSLLKLTIVAMKFSRIMTDRIERHSLAFS